MLCSLNSLENHKFNMSVKTIEVEMDKNAWLFLFCVKFCANWFLQQILETHFNRVFKFSPISQKKKKKKNRNR